MDRIATLIGQLQEAHKNGAAPAALWLLVQQLQAELQQQVRPAAVPASGRVAVVLPAAGVPALPGAPVTAGVSPVAPPPVPPQEKEVEVLQVDEKEVEAELEEIRQKAEFVQQMQAKQAQMKPGILFEFDDAADELPTFVHQPNYQPSPAPPPRKVAVSETGNGSLNERLREEKVEIVHRLSESPVKDLKKAIGINDRYVFINELFRGDEAMYERSIKTINNFSIFPEAQYWMERELKIKLGWDDERPATQEFYALVKRRFS
ncbi:MAG TPA: hypothetical protein PKE63_12790 [Lacibacter sp.]|nr:hypothetical protein [Lacibacter sp.]HMO89517.1 hypothetical protein [Lacibacter sp.]HMP88149.1 hypothetical protein [Lacibacter sp.]